MENKNQPPSQGRGRAALLARLLANKPGRIPQEAAKEPKQLEYGKAVSPVSEGSSSGVSIHRAEPAVKPSSPVSARNAFLKEYLGLASSSDSGKDSKICKTPLQTHSALGNVTMGRGRGRLLEAMPALISLNPEYQSPVQTASSSSSSAKNEIEVPQVEVPNIESLKIEVPQVEVVKKPEQTGKVEVYKGTSGTPIDVRSNYIRLKVEPNRGVFEYEVKFEPNIDSKGMRIELINQHLTELGGVKTFDGVTLYLPLQIENKKLISTNTLDKSKVTISIIFKRKKKLGECIHLYNVLFKRIMGSLDLVRFRRQHFDPTAPKILPQYQLEIWPGYVIAVDEYEGGVMLCLDVSHRVLRQKTALDHLRSLAKGDNANIRDNASKSLIGSCVLTRYNNRSYIIDEIAFDMCPLSTFENSRGENITFLDYYKKQYGIDILDMKQPLLVSHSKVKVSGQKEPVSNKLCLVPELAFLTGLTEENRNDFRLMKDLATYTRVTPNQRIYSLRKFIENVSKNEKCVKLLSSWGLSLDKDCIELTCRTLMPEDIRFGQQTVSATAAADWGRASTSNCVMEAVDITNWVIFHTERDYKYMQDFKSCMMRIGAPMGINVYNPIIVSLQNDRTSTFLEAIKRTMNTHRNLILLVFIFPTSRDDRYAAVKKLCCVDYGIASQVINSRTISKPDKIRSVVQKIALQINCKLGGSLWSVNIPLKDCMICGLDTYHDPTRRGKSVFGFVSTISQSCTKYFSQVGFQNPHEEIAQSLQACFRAALKRFFDYNGTFPKRIIFYRDGISVGQMEHCRQVEVAMIEECFSNDVFKTKPLLTFITVQKRINTRIMASAGRELSNPGPGTIVDHTITQKNMYDFFLVPQSVRQGTVSPTHYVVLRDTSGMKPDHVQRLSYKMCHLYYNWAGTIRVPACCQYAHKLAYLIGQSVKEKPHDKLVDRLYYL